MSELLRRPELALAALLVVLLLWVALGYWITMRPVGDEDLGARLDALAPVVDFANLPTVTRRRDYSGDRGVVPAGPPPAAARLGALVVPRWTDFYAELASRLGDPLGA